MADTTNEATKSILIVDDTATHREIAAFALGADGYRIETASNVPEAIDYITSQYFDAIVTDAGMKSAHPDPRFGGALMIAGAVEQCDQAEPDRPRTILIVMTAQGDSQQVWNRLATETNRVDRLLAKPFRPNALRELVAKAFQEVQKTRPTA